MLSSSARALRTASRRAMATSSKATPAKSAPMAVAADAAHHDDLPVSLSHGELAWCEVYGVDYEKMLKEAQEESPIVLNAPTPSAAPINKASQQDIWSVVFGTSK